MSSLASVRVISPTACLKNTKHSIRPRTSVRVRSQMDIVEGSRILGEGITAGVIFYTTLQWAHYRRLRIEAEKAIDEKERKKNDKNDKKAIKDAEE